MGKSTQHVAFGGDLLQFEEDQQSQVATARTSISKKSVAQAESLCNIISKKTFDPNAFLMLCSIGWRRFRGEEKRFNGISCESCIKSWLKFS